MFTTRPEISGSFGVVSSTHWIASAVAFGVLEQGGNAFDAAVAGGFVLHAVEPHLNGAGGDMTLLFQPADGRPRVLCGQGVAPAAATRQHFDTLGLSLVPSTGLLAAVVPGAVDAWLRLALEHGSWPLRRLLEPAIHYLRNGVPVLARIHDQIATVAEFMSQHWPDSAAIYLPGGRPPATGSLLKNPTLAATWTRFIETAEAAGGNREAQLEAARRAWSQGFVAAAIDDYCRNREVVDSTGRAQRALLSGDDLAGWQASIEDPVSVDYGELTVCKCGPWSQGPVALQTLRLLAGFELDKMDPQGPEFIHTVVEAIKLAYADREAYYGDPEFVDVPLTELLAEDYASARRALIGERASTELRPGSVAGREPLLPDPPALSPAEQAMLAPLGIGEPTVAQLPDGGLPGFVRGGDTCHIDVIDRHGNMVAAMPSGGWLHGSPAIPELGFSLTTRAQMFWLTPGLPATLAPGKRPRTTLTPSLALRDGKPYMVYGTPGGDQQDQWQLIFLLRHYHHGLNLQQAIDLPSFHSEHFPSSFYPRAAAPGKLCYEDRLADATVAELRRRGHHAVSSGSWSEGRLCAASQCNGVLKAAANPRGMQGYAVGR